MGSLLGRYLLSGRLQGLPCLTGIIAWYYYVVRVSIHHCCSAEIWSKFARWFSWFWGRLSFPVCVGHKTQWGAFLWTVACCSCFGYGSRLWWGWLLSLVPPFLLIGRTVLSCHSWTFLHGWSWRQVWHWGRGVEGGGNSGQVALGGVAIQ